jgi:hypothetical protein
VIDFKNRVFNIQDGVLHLNPAFFELPKPTVAKDESTYRRWEQKDLNMHNHWCDPGAAVQHQ